METQYTDLMALVRGDSDRQDLEKRCWRPAGQTPSMEDIPRIKNISKTFCQNCYKMMMGYSVSELVWDGIPYRSVVKTKMIVIKCQYYTVCTIATFVANLWKLSGEQRFLFHHTIIVQ